MVRPTALAAALLQQARQAAAAAAAVGLVKRAGLPLLGWAALQRQHYGVRSRGAHPRRLATASTGTTGSTNGSAMGSGDYLGGGGLRIPPANSGLPAPKVEATAAAGPCLTYWIGNTLYVAVTNRCNTVPLHMTRGPGFSFDGFSPLPPAYEPNDEEVFQAVQGALSAAHCQFGPRVWTEICFAGWGEPTLRWEVAACVGERLLRSTHGNGVKLRLNTNGLGSVAQQRPLAPEVAELFHAVTVAMNTADPNQYDALMRPNLHMRGEALALEPMSVLSTGTTTSGLGAGSAGLRHTAPVPIATGTGNAATAMAAATGMASAEASEALNLVGHFVRDCVAHGVDTQVTAVARPDVDVEAVRRLAQRLGASFRSRSYFP